MFAIQAEAFNAIGRSSSAACRPQTSIARQGSRHEIVVSIVEADSSGSAEPISLSHAEAFIAVVPLPRDLEDRAQLGPVSFVDLRRTRLCDRTELRSVQFYFPRAALRATAEQNGYNPVESLGREASINAPDDTLCRLAIALEPALLRPHDASLLFVCSVIRAAVVHFIARFAEKRTAQVFRGGLAPWQQKRAREMLEANLDRDVSLAEIAAQCRLSARHFSRAFSQSMGMPPQRWLTKHRVETAKSLLLEPQHSIADVAKTVGFSDQSHMTRVFSEWVGQSPGTWRRANALAPQPMQSNQF